MSVTRKGGWIPPAVRTRYQTALTGKYHEMIQTFGDMMQESVTEPERVILGELEIQTGGLMPRVNQKSGSCVGAATGCAYSQAMAGDVVFRGNIEEVKLIFPWATYGVGRKIAGMNGPGEGSFGAAQAEACQPDEFGYLPWDDERVPPPTIRDGWAIWSAQKEKDWSHPSVWKSRNGYSRSELQDTADDFGIHTVTKVTNVDELVQALAQGYGVTQAGMFGSKGSQVKGDVAIWNWDGSWAHQMSLGGYWKHPTHGLIFWCQNQWNKMESLHTPCPTMGPLGINGGAWQTASTQKRIFDDRQSEVYAHSATGGFPTQEFEWNLTWPWR